jgi:hypothetical protein
VREQTAITLEKYAGNEIRLDLPNQWIEVEWHGAITAQGIMDLFSRIYRLPNWHPGLARLMVYHPDSYMGELDIASAEALRDHLIEHREVIFGRETPLVGYVSDDPLKVPYLEYWAELLNQDTPFKSRVFSRFGDAVDWVRAERIEAEGRMAKR